MDKSPLLFPAAASIKLRFRDIYMVIKLRFRDMVSYAPNVCSSVQRNKRSVHCTLLSNVHMVVEMSIDTYIAT